MSAAVDTKRCADCGAEPKDTHAIRLVGRDGSGRVVSLCPRCWIKRGKE